LYSVFLGDFMRKCVRKRERERDAYTAMATANSSEAAALFEKLLRNSFKVTKHIHR